MVRMGWKKRWLQKFSAVKAWGRSVGRTAVEFVSGNRYRARKLDLSSAIRMYFWQAQTPEPVSSCTLQTELANPCWRITKWSKSHRRSDIFYISSTLTLIVLFSFLFSGMMKSGSGKWRITARAAVLQVGMVRVEGSMADRRLWNIYLNVDMYSL